MLTLYRNRRNCGSVVLGPSRSLWNHALHASNQRPHGHGDQLRRPEHFSRPIRPLRTRWRLQNHRKRSEPCQRVLRWQCSGSLLMYRQGRRSQPVSNQWLTFSNPVRCGCRDSLDYDVHPFAYHCHADHGRALRSPSLFAETTHAHPGCGGLTPC
jgi:hypothetical protein